MKTAQLLKDARRRRGDSQERAAVMCRTNRTTWAAWEAGDPPAKFIWLSALSTYTGVSEDELALMILDDMRSANLLLDASPIPGSVWSPHYHPSRGDAGRFRCGRRTHPERGAVATYGRQGGDRRWVTGDACRGSTSICTATA